MQSNIFLQCDNPNSLKDSNDYVYVNSVMMLQLLLTVLLKPLLSSPSGRKRHLLMPTVSVSDLKKIRRDMRAAHNGDQSDADDECDTDNDRF